MRDLPGVDAPDRVRGKALRLRAWSYQVVPDGDGWATQEAYPCRVWCGLGTAQPADDQRRLLRCALPGFAESDWIADGETPRPFMGRLPIYGEPEPDDDVRAELGEQPDKPRDSHDEGCPGAWYRCGFVASLQKYERLLLDSGFSSNLLADRTEDPLVIEALQFLESERVRARAHAQELRNRTDK